MKKRRQQTFKIVRALGGLLKFVTFAYRMISLECVVGGVVGGAILEVHGGQCRGFVEGGRVDIDRIRNWR